MFYVYQSINNEKACFIDTASVFCISQVFSNVRTVLSQSNTRLRLLHLLYDIEIMLRKNNNTRFSMFILCLTR